MTRNGVSTAVESNLAVPAATSANSGFPRVSIAWHNAAYGKANAAAPNDVACKKSILKGCDKVAAHSSTRAPVQARSDGDFGDSVTYHGTKRNINRRILTNIVDAMLLKAEFKTLILSFREISLMLQKS